MSSIEAGITVVREADLLVGVHGAVPGACCTSLRLAAPPRCAAPPTASNAAVLLPAALRPPRSRRAPRPPPRVTAPATWPMHAGANMANAWFARPGTSILEIFPFEWAEGRGALTYSVFDQKARAACLLLPVLRPPPACLLWAVGRRPPAGCGPGRPLAAY